MMTKINTMKKLGLVWWSKT